MQIFHYRPTKAATYWFLAFCLSITCACVKIILKFFETKLIQNWSQNVRSPSGEMIYNIALQKKKQSIRFQFSTANLLSVWMIIIGDKNSQWNVGLYYYYQLRSIRVFKYFRSVSRRRIKCSILFLSKSETRCYLSS